VEAWHLFAMGIFGRVAQVMSSNFNALLDKAKIRGKAWI